MEWQRKTTMWAHTKASKNVSAIVFLFDDRVKIGKQKAKNSSTLTFFFLRFFSGAIEIKENSRQKDTYSAVDWKRENRHAHKTRRTKSHSKIITQFFNS